MKNRDSPYVFGEVDDIEASFVPRWEDSPPADGELQDRGEDNETVIVEGRAMSLRNYLRTRSDEE